MSAHSSKGCHTGGRLPGAVGVQGESRCWGYPTLSQRAPTHPRPGSVKSSSAVMASSSGRGSISGNRVRPAACGHFDCEPLNRL